MLPPEHHIQIGSILFDGLDQIDLTGPYEVLATIPNATFTVAAKSLEPMRDFRGMRLMADTTFGDAPQFDVLHIPGGPGQQALMEDEEVLSFIRTQAASADYVLSVCTGALVCGAAGLLVGRKATTHWSAHHLLPYFGAEAVNERVVIDGNWIFAAGVTSGIDGALHLAAMLRGQKVAEQIQLYMQYQPEPPFDAGTPERAPAEVLEAARAKAGQLTADRLATAKKIAAKLNIDPGAAAG
ncbi:MAG TPA: AraC family transcriptional regulator [Rhodospirillaceae bacterium]|nr:AraC family transcriptional regulator [Rhodospirillaceae bacterium]